MQKFQSLSTKTKVAIATVALVGVIGAGIVASPTITGNEQPTNVTPIPCLYHAHSHGGEVDCLDGRITPPPPNDPGNQPVPDNSSNPSQP